VTKAFIGTDVIVDLVAKRHPFDADARGIFDSFEKRRARGFVCSLSFPNLHYLMRKDIGPLESIRTLQKLRTIVTILAVDESVIVRAMSSSFGDFEDAVQYYSAVQGGMDCIVTRNLADYKKSEIKVFSPSEFLKSLAG
jgi:predicted nucleic acid-binding protein